MSVSWSVETLNFVRPMASLIIVCFISYTFHYPIYLQCLTYASGARFRFPYRLFTSTVNHSGFSLAVSHSFITGRVTEYQLGCFLISDTLQCPVNDFLSQGSDTEPVDWTFCCRSFIYPSIIFLCPCPPWPALHDYLSSHLMFQRISG